MCVKALHYILSHPVLLKEHLLCVAYMYMQVSCACDYTSKVNAEYEIHLL